MRVPGQHSEAKGRQIFLLEAHSAHNQRDPKAGVRGNFCDRGVARSQIAARSCARDDLDRAHDSAHGIAVFHEGRSRLLLVVFELRQRGVSPSSTPNQLQRAIGYLQPDYRKRTIPGVYAVARENARMSMDSDIRTWLERACALVDGVPLDYVAIHYRQSSKSWPEHASVRVEGRPPADVITEVLGHVGDVAESAVAEGHGGVAIRLKLVRAKSPAGTRTFRGPGGPAGSDSTSDEADDSPKGALVATVHELRLLTGAVVSELASQSAAGWKLANDLQGQCARLSEQLAEARAEIRYSLTAAAPEPDEVHKMALEFLPQLPGMLSSLAQLAEYRSKAAPVE